MRAANSGGFADANSDESLSLILADLLVGVSGRVGDSFGERERGIFFALAREEEAWQRYFCRCSGQESEVQSGRLNAINRESLSRG